MFRNFDCTRRYSLCKQLWFSDGYTCPKQL